MGEVSQAGIAHSLEDWVDVDSDATPFMTAPVDVEARVVRARIEPGFGDRAVGRYHHTRRGLQVPRFEHRLQLGSPPPRQEQGATSQGRHSQDEAHHVRDGQAALSGVWSLHGATRRG